MSKRLIKAFDDHDNFSNVIVPLSLDIESVVYVYHHDINENKKENCLKVIKNHKNIEVKFLKIEEDEISNLIKDNEIIDVSANKYISLVLCGYALKNDLEIIYYDGLDRIIKEYHSHKIICDELVKLSIEDLLTLNGGRIVSSLHRPCKDKKTVELIYSAIEKNKKDYSVFTNYVSKINSLIINCEHKDNIYYINDNIKNKITSDENFQRYNELGLFKIEDNKVIFYNTEIRKLFLVSGTFLENYIYHKLIDGNLFDDVKMSVTIEFNSEQWRYPVNCELDCLILKDNNLLFTSIKSNKVETDDLNEIKVHNVMFGNEYSKPVVCINNDLNVKRPNIYAKAEELGIYIIDETTFLNGNIARVFLSIIDGTYNYEKIGG